MEELFEILKNITDGLFRVAETGSRTTEYAASLGVAVAELQRRMALAEERVRNLERGMRN